MDAPELVIRARSALIGRELVAVPDPVVVVKGAVIVDVGPRGRVDEPAGATVIDAGELTLVPGFIDTHVHIGLFEPNDVVKRGVTTVRDLAWPPERIFPLVERSRSDGFEGPTIHAAGPMLTVPGGYPLRAAWAPPGTGVPLSSQTDAAEAVERAAAQGAAIIKVGLDPRVGPTASLELLTAIVRAAHEHALKVTAHIAGVDELIKALDAGVDELAHMLMSTERIPDPVIDRMVAQRVVIVPTLSCRAGRDLALATDNLRRYLAAGGRCIYGTDLGNEGPRPGIDAREVTAMAAAGMSPTEIVRSATVDAAEWLALEQEIGALATGMTADIVGLAGDPAADVDALTNVRLVIRRGRVRRAP